MFPEQLQRKSSTNDAVPTSLWEGAKHRSFLFLLVCCYTVSRCQPNKLLSKNNHNFTMFKYVKIQCGRAENP